MLAQTAGSVKEAITAHGGKTAFEYKYDGARVQIHKQNGKAKIFSRRLTDLTESLPEIIDNVKNNIKAETIIIEGEVIAQDIKGVPIAFQHLMRRFKRIKEISAIKEEIPLTLYLFDILYLNGNSLIDKSYKELRQILAENAGNIFLANQIVIYKPEQAQKFLK
jgi:DNA ligase-1